MFQTLNNLLKPLWTRADQSAPDTAEKLSQPEQAPLLAAPRDEFINQPNPAIPPQAAPIQPATASQQSFYSEHLATPLRLAAGAAALYDLGTNKAGGFAFDGSLDTLPGTIGAILAFNWVFGKVVGTKLSGLDTAAPLSFAAFQLLRVMAGAAPTDMSHINFNEFFFFRFIAEFGNYLTLLPTLGRLYLRPDLRQALAQGLGNQADPGVGESTDYGWIARQAKVSKWLPPFVATALAPLERIPKAPLMGLFLDSTVGALYRYVTSDKLKIALRPITLWNHPTSHPNLQRLGRLFLKGHGGKAQNDLMKPTFSQWGRFLTLAQGMAINVPYQGALAMLQGMTPSTWVMNRLSKMALWAYFGQPTKVRMGGDTPKAMMAGFAIGLCMDYGVTLFFNPRYEKREWAPEFHDALADVAADPQNSQILSQASARILDGIIVDHLTAWDLTDAANHAWNSGEWRIRYYDDKFVATLATEVEKLSPEERKALALVTESLKEKNFERSVQKEGLDHLLTILSPS